MTENEQNEQHEFICLNCNYKTCKKSNYKRHILTDKHKIMTNSDQNEQNEQKRYFTCGCGKKYKHKQGLSHHKKKCILKFSETSIIQIENKK